MPTWNSKNYVPKIPLWKKALILAFIVFFGSTLLRYFRGQIDGGAAWLWPMLFVQLILYLLGVVYGDVPARSQKKGRIQPFPTPFAHQYDRCVLALLVLFTGLLLNVIFLLASILVHAAPILIGLYSLYMVLMLVELPNSLRIFRFIQHINTIQYVNVLDPNTFKPALSYHQKQSSGMTRAEQAEYLRTLHANLEAEATSLIQEESPLRKDQQIALNLAVRSGEAIRRSVEARERGEELRFKANAYLLQALKQHAGLELPSDIAQQTAAVLLADVN